jgi:hypothetical protein
VQQGQATWIGIGSSRSWPPDQSAGVVGRAVAGHQRKGGQTTQGARAPGHSVTAPGVGAMGGGDAPAPPLLERTFRRLEARVGSTKAAVAVAHTLVVSIDPRRLEGTFYEERGARLVPRQEAQHRKRAIQALECLGYMLPTRDCGVRGTPSG